MRQPLLTVVLALSLALTACDPPKTVAPPNPVGTWEEKTRPPYYLTAAPQLLTRLELKADGDFTREVRRDRVNAKTETVSGSWSVQATELEPPWWERIWPQRSPSDVKETVRRSHGRIVLNYSVARGSDLAVGAKVVGKGGILALEDMDGSEAAGVASVRPLAEMAGKEAPKFEPTEERWRIEEDHGLILETDEKTGGQKLVLTTYDETVVNALGHIRIQSFQRVDRF